MKNKITELYAGNAEFYSKDRKIPLIDLTVDEKNRVKIGLLTVLLSENDNSIKGLLAECIKAVAEIDYPERYVRVLFTQSFLLFISCFFLSFLFLLLFLLFYYEVAANFMFSLIVEMRMFSAE